jgi:hypothetical protein
MDFYGDGHTIIPQEQPLTYRNITPLQWVILIFIWIFALAVYIKFFKSIIKEKNMKNKFNKEGIT